MVSALLRLCYTPLQDLLCGHISGRLNWRKAIKDSDLGSGVKSLISTIVAKTRLSRIEKAEVASELMDHFISGLAGGENVTELIDEFGDPHQAAWLIRRSKVRSHPILWLACKWSCLAMGVLLACYCGLAAYFYLGYPSPRVDFFAQMNGQEATTPEQQRAWPIYRSALLSLRTQDWTLIQSGTSDPQSWRPVCKWVDSHQQLIDSIRKANKLPAMGFFISRRGSMADPALFSIVQRCGIASNAEALLNLQMPQLQCLRVIADLICLDAKRARELSQGDSVERDISALSAMADQQHGEGEVALVQLFSLGVRSRSYDELDRTLVQAPQLLNDSALVRLANHLGKPQTANDIVSFDYEPLLFDDTIQRIFTDDGQGDGRLCAQGLDFFRENFSNAPSTSQAFFIGNPARVVLQPLSLLVMTSKKQLVQENNFLMAANQASIRVPLRDADLMTSYNERHRLSASPLLRMRYGVLLVLTSTEERSAQLAEQSLGERDGLLVGIALEQYRRQHQHYPDALAQLVPDWLTCVPADRITGDPVKYRLIGGKPLVYSVGVDRIDDGGRLPMHNGAPAPDSAAQWGPQLMIPNGDWVLYPKPRMATFQE